MDSIIKKVVNSWMEQILIIEYQIIKPSEIGNILYVISEILLILWGIGYQANYAGTHIHRPLLFAIIILLLKIINEDKIVN